MSNNPPNNDDSTSAADLIRKKVQSSYKRAPSATEDALDVAELGANINRSKHQQFIYDLTNSGKSVAEIQTAWHEYYAGLTDAGKHEVWNEFNSTHAQNSHFITGAPTPKPQPHAKPVKLPDEPSGPKKTMADLKDNLVGNVTNRKKIKPKQHFQSLLFGFGVGSIVIIIFLFSFFNERFIAPFIQPSRTVTNTPIITGSAAIGSAPEVIIPKINVEIPVVYGVNSASEAEIQNALEGGVVHYTNTALPGTNGNVAIVGHSSNNIFNKGKYKFAFVLLSRLEIGDTFYLQKDGKRYTYQVYDKKIVKPTDVGVLAATDKPAVATLITCDPPGTSTNRLVVVGQQINPDPVTNIAGSQTEAPPAQAAIIPGNSPSLWSRFVSIF